MKVISNFEAKTTKLDSAQLADLVRRDALIARAMLRTLIFACQAQDDNCMAYPDGKTSRWSPLVVAVTERLSGVRDALIHAEGAPCVDWHTPLTAIEALDAALWGRAQASIDDEGEDFIAFELGLVAQAIVDMLDVMVGQLGRVPVAASKGCAAV